MAATGEGDLMVWWGWLLMAWLPVAVLSAMWMGLAIRLAESREWRRRDAAARRRRSEPSAAGPIARSDAASAHRVPPGQPVT
jgi:hypothetical protein